MQIVLFKMSDQQGETMDTTEVNVVNEDERKLFVGGLPQDAKDTDIKEHFGQFGEIDGVNLKTDPATGRSRGFAFVVSEATIKHPWDNITFYLITYIGCKYTSTYNILKGIQRSRRS